PARTVQFGPRPDVKVRLKSSEKMTVGGPASGGPASGGPASGGPASGRPASGGPASGGPASGGPASGGGGPASGVPPSVLPELPVVLTVKLPNQMPARFVAMPAVPGSTIAEGVESETMSFTTPLTDATSWTWFAPVADSE